MAEFTSFRDLTQEVSPPESGILSRTVFTDERVKVVLFGFAPTEELSEHTASMPAILHFLQGDARVTLGDQVLEVHAGSWIHMAKNLRHSVLARTPVVMQLTLLK